MLRGRRAPDGTPDPATRARRSVWRVVAVAAVVILGFGLLGGLGLRELQGQQDDLHDLVEAEEVEDDIEAADRCVTAWEVRAEIRESDEEHGVAGGEALIEVFADADPALVAQYRAVLSERMASASDVIEDPDCDLEAARALLANPPTTTTVPS